MYYIRKKLNEETVDDIQIYEMLMGEVKICTKKKLIAPFKYKKYG